MYILMHYFNGLEFLTKIINHLLLGSRIKTSVDFGMVSLDIASLRSSDAGIYTCQAVNMNGEATSTTSIKVQGEYYIIFMYLYEALQDKSSCFYKF